MNQRLCCSRTESFNSFFYNYLLIFLGRGGTLVDSMPLDRKVVSSNPILAATPGSLGKSFTNSIHYILYTVYYRPILYTFACSASSCKLRHRKLPWSRAPLSSSRHKEAL